MLIEVTMAEFTVLKDLVEMTKCINSQTSIKYNCEVDGWHGKGKVTFNRHEHNGKLRFLIGEEVKR